MKGIYYNYDLEECNWMFKQGVHPIGCGKHDKTGNTFIIFCLKQANIKAESLSG